ncbi:Hypothetical_protein [Hexamita inflata]|uniref:Hypothetical_protein n=1 Tax=Hexamita inflata TaxID=28002 RepID=A0AA86NRT4_9EUKA|nr:Hypothetical protein HINF_LOCUS12403 [Hexamita inflata]
MSATFKILCALADANAQDITDKQAERIIRILLENKLPQPCKSGVQYLKELTECLDEQAICDPPLTVSQSQKDLSISEILQTDLIKSKIQSQRQKDAIDKTVTRHKIGHAQHVLSSSVYSDVDRVCPVSKKVIKNVVEAEEQLLKLSRVE